jgi:hypothetical protein
MMRSFSSAYGPLLTLLRALARAAVVLLVAFHAWLLLTRLGSGAILEPTVALKWLWTAGLGLSWLVMRRRMSVGANWRHSLAFWLLVFLVHLGGTPITPVGSMLVGLPFAEISTLSAPLTLIGLLLIFAVRRRSPRTLLRARARFLLFREPSRLLTWPRLFCRPPPSPSPSF